MSKLALNSPLVLLTFPFWIATTMFVCIYFFLPIEKLQHIVNSTEFLFQLTSINTAAEVLRDFKIYYFWVYSLSFVPIYVVTLFVWYRAALKHQKSKFGINNAEVRIAFGSAGLALSAFYILFLTSDSYTGVHFMILFPSNVAGCFLFAFFLYFLTFFSVFPVLKCLSFVSRLQSRFV